VRRTGGTKYRVRKSGYSSPTNDSQAYIPLLWWGKAPVVHFLRPKLSQRYQAPKIHTSHEDLPDFFQSKESSYNKLVLCVDCEVVYSSSTIHFDQAFFFLASAKTSYLRYSKTKLQNPSVELSFHCFHSWLSKKHISHG
jgi:hypothetical protein